VKAKMLSSVRGRLLVRPLALSFTSNSTEMFQQVWSPQVVAPLARIRGRVSSVVSELVQLRPESVAWGHAVEAVNSIALSAQATFLRPQLVLLGHAAARGSISNLQGVDDAVEGFAAGVELQHLFMLVHDDVMDRGTLRRGMATTHRALQSLGVEIDVAGNAVTVVGDVVHARAMALVVESALAVAHRETDPATIQSAHDAINVTMDSAYRAGVAQFEDILGWRAARTRLNSPESVDKFISQFTYDKGAHHTFVAPLVAGLKLGGGHEQLEAISKTWGTHAGGHVRRPGLPSPGLAFQGLDDLMDLVSDPLNLGKDTFQVRCSDFGDHLIQDVNEGRLSLPLILLHRACEEAEWEQVLAMRGGFFGDMAARRTWHNLVSKYELFDRTLVWIEGEIAAAEKDVTELRDDDSAASSTLAEGLSAFTQGLRQHAKAVAEQTKQ